MVHLDMCTVTLEKAPMLTSHRRVNDESANHGGTPRGNSLAGVKATLPRRANRVVFPNKIFIAYLPALLPRKGCQTRTLVMASTGAIL